MMIQNHHACGFKHVVRMGKSCTMVGKTVVVCQDCIPPTMLLSERTNESKTNRVSTRSLCCIEEIGHLDLIGCSFPSLDVPVFCPAAGKHTHRWTPPNSSGRRSISPDDPPASLYHCGVVWTDHHCAECAPCRQSGRRSNDAVSLRTAISQRFVGLHLCRSDIGHHWKLVGPAVWTVHLDL